MIADLAIVRHMNVVHQQYVVTDPRDHPTTLCSPMNRREFTNLIVIADFEARGFAVIFQILRVCSKRGELKNPVALTDRRMTVDNSVRSDGGAGSNLDVRPDNHTGADVSGGIDFGAWVYYRRGMNTTSYGSCPSTSIAESSASAASSPSTRASPRIFHSGW